MIQFKKRGVHFQKKTWYNSKEEEKSLKLINKIL